MAYMWQTHGGKDCVLTWGDLTDGETWLKQDLPWEVSRSHSSDDGWWKSARAKGL